MAYGGFLSLSGIRGLKVWMESVGVVLLLGKVSHGNLILFPECVDVVCWAEGKAYGTVPRPGHHFEARTVQLAEKIAVDVPYWTLHGGLAPGEYRIRQKIYRTNLKDAGFFAVATFTVA